MSEFILKERLALEEGDKERFQAGQFSEGGYLMTWMGWIGCLLVLLGHGSAGDLYAEAESWPQFLGPHRDAHYRGAPLAGQFPKEGPVKLWTKSVGQGFSGPVVADGKLILFHRLGDREVVECVAPNNGETVWKFGYPTDYRDDFGFDEGPRATPTIHANRVYTHGAQGKVHCLDLNTGERVWSVDTEKAFGSPKGFFGRVCSPLVVNQAILLNVGGKNGAGIVAFDKDSGDVLWQATDHKASYASPIVKRRGDTRTAIFFTRHGLVGLDPGQGKVLFQHRWRSRMRASVNAANPVVVGHRIFLSACYGTGAILLNLKEGRLSEVWSSQDTLSNHYATSVYKGGYLYGYHGRVDVPPDPSLRCVDFETGEVAWTNKRFGAGSLILADDLLVALKQSGQLFLIKATPEKFTVLDQAQILAPTVRAYPALVAGRLYARNEGQLACFELGKED